MRFFGGSYLRSVHYFFKCCKCFLFSFWSVYVLSDHKVVVCFPFLKGLFVSCLWSIWLCSIFEAFILFPVCEVFVCLLCTVQRLCPIYQVLISYLWSVFNFLSMRYSFIFAEIRTQSIYPYPTREARSIYSLPMYELCIYFPMAYLFPVHEFIYSFKRFFIYFPFMKDVFSNH